MAKEKSASAKREANTKNLEKISLKKLSEKFDYGDTVSFVSEGVSDYEDEEYGRAYVLGNETQIMFISEGFQAKSGFRETVVHKALREAIEANGDIVNHRFTIVFRLHKPSDSRYSPYWTVDKISIHKDAIVEERTLQKTIVEYI